MSQGIGKKYDAGKAQWGLLRKGLVHALEGVIKVLEFGAKKYAANSWQTVPNGEERYRDALDRHLAEIDKGIVNDPETGLPHIYHVACNALFLAHFHAVSGADANPPECESPLFKWDPVYGRRISMADIERHVHWKNALGREGQCKIKELNFAVGEPEQITSWFYFESVYDPA